jgi:hypothetical protein
MAQQPENKHLRPISSAMVELVERPCSAYAYFTAKAEQWGVPKSTKIKDLLALITMAKAAMGKQRPLPTVLDRVDGPLAKTVHIGGAADAPALRFEFAEAQPPAEEKADGPHDPPTA